MKNPKNPTRRTQEPKHTKNPKNPRTQAPEEPKNPLKEKNPIFFLKNPVLLGSSGKNPYPNPVLGCGNPGRVREPHPRVWVPVQHRKLLWCKAAIHDSKGKARLHDSEGKAAKTMTWRCCNASPRQRQRCCRYYCDALMANVVTDHEEWMLNYIVKCYSYNVTWCRHYVDEFNHYMWMKIILGGAFIFVF